MDASYRGMPCFRCRPWSPGAQNSPVCAQIHPLPGCAVQKDGKTKVHVSVHIAIDHTWLCASFRENYSILSASFEGFHAHPGVFWTMRWPGEELRMWMACCLGRPMLAPFMS